MSMLLKGGTVLVHDKIDDSVRPEKLDMLIKDSLIVAMGPGIQGREGTEVIDCTGKIISPGFIDTHHHLWQTCLKASHPNDTLLDYFWKGVLTFIRSAKRFKLRDAGHFPGSMLSPGDVFWSQLAGAMECVDSGTTTVVDHAAINYSEEHSSEALRATVGSGIRSIFGYCPTPAVTSWSPKFKLGDEMLAPWVMDNFDRLASQNPFGPNGRVRLGFAFDGLWLPKQQLQELFARVRKGGSQLITIHAGYCASFGAPDAPSIVERLQSKDLLRPDLLLSHLTNPKLGDTRAMAECGASVSTTPSTELQMGHGNPTCFDDHLKPAASLGIDCHSVCSAYIPGQMNLALQWARARRHEAFESSHTWSRTVGYTVNDVFNFGTIQGARAVGMGEEIGSLAVGKKADVVIFDGESPGMLVAAERNPVAAIVQHSSIRDVDMVIIDGIVRKRFGQLTSVRLPNADGTIDECDGELVTWKDVMDRAVVLAREMEERKQVIDGHVAEEGVISAYHMNPAARH